tara:strand:- start:6642 stop:7889 length:1248 start_codon:yes stop_codon:yes gene_type:complete
LQQQDQDMPAKTPIAVTATLGLAMMLASLGTTIANIALPTLAEAFAAPFSQVQAVVVAYLAALTVSVVVAGRLGDRWGLKPMLMVGIGVFLAATLVASLSKTLSLLIATRAIQGIGAAFMMTLSMALMRQAANSAAVGRAMGLLGTMSAVGTALGPSLGGLLISAAGWRGIFGVQVPFSVIALVLVYKQIPVDEARSSMAGPGLLSVLNRPLVRNLIVNLLVAAVMMTTLVVGPFYLNIALGLEPAMVGLVMAIGPMMSIVLGVPSGQLVDSWGSRRVLLVGLGLVGAGAFLLALLPEVIGGLGYVACLVVLTPGYQLFQAANNTKALADVPRDHRGTTAGLLSLSRNLGLVAGASIMGAVFAFGAGTADFTHADASAIVAGMRLAFVLAGALMLAALGIAAKEVAPYPAEQQSK